MAKRKKIDSTAKARRRRLERRPSAELAPRARRTSTAKSSPRSIAAREVAQQIGRAEAGRRAARLRSAARGRSARARRGRQSRARSATMSVRAVFRELISGTRAVQTPIRVAYLGPEFTFSHLAAIERFGQIGRAGAGRHDRGRVRGSRARPGRVRRRADGELDRRPRLRHARLLLALARRGSAASCRCGFIIACWASARATSVRTVYSKPQPLSQCRNWLAKHLPQAELREVASTAEAAKRAKDDPDVGRGRQRPGGRQLRPAGAGRRTSRTTRTTSRGSP